MSNARYGGNSDKGRDFSKSDEYAMPAPQGSGQRAAGAALAATGGYQFVRAHRLPKTYASKIQGFDSSFKAAKSKLRKPGGSGLIQNHRIRVHAAQQMASDVASKRVWSNALKNVKPRQVALRRAGAGLAATGVGLAMLGAHKVKQQREAGLM